MRRELGLPSNGPILMSGHHCEFWHPGILAKWFALQSCAARLPGATTAWVEVDQDSNAAWQIAYPGPGPARAAWRLPLASRDAPAPDTPTGALPPVQPSNTNVEALEPPPGYEFATHGLRAMAQALTAHQDSRTLAEQVTLARNDLLAWTGPRPAGVFATALARTTRFGEALERMRRDPRTCVELLNRASAAFPEARVRALEISSGRIELPLWRVERDEPRRRVFTDDLADIPIQSLAPRALLMTALLRAGACDLFVHGLGGERYDRATDQWIAQWLGWDLAPTVMVTATRYLPFDAPDVPTPEAIARARWAAWHALTEPAMLGDREGAERKRELVAAIRAAGERPRRTSLFRQLRSVVETSRARHAARVQALAAEAETLRGRRGTAQIVFDRTWPFPLYPREVLEDLAREVARPFAQT